jgi:hypothetical protein
MMVVLKAGWLVSTKKNCSLLLHKRYTILIVYLKMAVAYWVWQQNPRCEKTMKLLERYALYNASMVWLFPEINYFYLKTTNYFKVLTCVSVVRFDDYDDKVLSILQYIIDSYRLMLASDDDLHKLTVEVGYSDIRQLWWHMMTWWQHFNRNR